MHPLSNKYVEYIDANTKQILFTELFYDPELRWHKNRDGIWFPAGIYGGWPTSEWYAKNPMPR